MRPSSLYCAITIAGLCLLSPLHSVAQYKLAGGVVANGGSLMSGGGYAINGTVGQGAIGTATDASRKTCVGFWYAQRSIVTGVDPAQPLPAVYRLEQNYPNPFNPGTTISYSIAKRGQVLLVVFNTLGQRVAQLVNGEVEAGYYEVLFDGNNLASGTYFYRLQAGTFVETRKFLLLK